MSSRQRLELCQSIYTSTIDKPKHANDSRAQTRPRSSRKHAERSKTAYTGDAADAKPTKQHQERKRTNGQNKSSSKQRQQHDGNQTKAQDPKQTCNDTSRAHGNNNGKNTGGKSHQTGARLHNETETSGTAGDYMREPAKERAP